MVYQKADGIAVFAAAKTMEELLSRADCERGRFFTVEGAQPHVISTAFFEGDVTSYHLDHVSTVEEFLDEDLWNRHESKDAYLGARRIAPSKRMTSPLSISFSKMCKASLA